MFGATNAGYARCLCQSTIKGCTMICYCNLFTLLTTDIPRDTLHSPQTSCHHTLLHYLHASPCLVYSTSQTFVHTFSFNSMRKCVQTYCTLHFCHVCTHLDHVCLLSPTGSLNVFPMSKNFYFLLFLSPVLHSGIFLVKSAFESSCPRSWTSPP